MAGLRAQGMMLKRGDGASPEVFTSIGNLVSIGGPGGEAADIDITDLESAAKEYVTGLKEGGEVACEGNFVPSDTQQQALIADYNNDVLSNWQLILTDFPGGTPSMIEFAGRVKAFSIQGAVDEKISMSFTVKLTGDWTLTPGSA